METRDVVTIICMISTIILSLIFGTMQNRRATGNDIEKRITDARERAAADARIESKLTDISSDTRDIKSELTSVRSDVSKMSERLVVVEQSTKSAHKRLDEIESKK